MDISNLTEFFTIDAEKLIKKYFGGERYKLAENGVYLLAHTDTVHKRLPKKSEIVINDGVYSAPGVGLGADDRAGCFIIRYLMDKYPECGYLLSPDEETGDKRFLEEVPDLPDPKVFLSFDQFGDANFLNYDYRSKEIEAFLLERGLSRWITSGTSCVHMSKSYGVPCVNMCVGAHNLHNTDEYLDTNAMIGLVPVYEDLIEFCMRHKLKLYDGGKCRKIYDRADKHHNNGKFALAIKCYTAALNHAEDDAERGDILTYRGFAYRWDDHADKALADFNAALKCLPEFTWAYVGRGDVYRFIGKREKAIADYTVALSLGVDKVAILLRLGNVYCYDYSDKYGEAIACYTAVLESDPLNVEALKGRGDAYYNSDEFERAAVDYTAALEIDPRNARTFRDRGDARHSVGKYDLAIANYTAALEIDPKDIVSLRRRGKTYYCIGAHDQAIADCTAVLAADPKDIFAMYYRGLAYDGNGQYDLAVANFSAVLELEPKHIGSKRERGISYGHIKDYPNAIADLTAVLKRVPNDIIARRFRGRWYYEIGDMKKAAADYEKILRFAKDDSDIAGAKTWLKKIADAGIAKRKQKQ